MTTGQSVPSGAIRNWRPVGSVGAAFGAGLVVLTVVCTIVLIGADVATASTPTRIVTTVGVAVGLSVLLMTALGTWWCLTLRYVLAPTAVEMRFGERLIRLRYDEIEEITGAPDDVPAVVPCLWPGAYFGRSTTAAGARQLWRATTRAPGAAVIIAAGERSHVITPSAQEPFRELLIEHARSAPYSGPSRAPTRATWLDAISSMDGWVRALLLGAGVVATGAIALDVGSFGGLQRDGLTAMVIVLANAVAALVLSIRWPFAARIVAAGAIASAAIALF